MQVENFAVQIVDRSARVAVGEVRVQVWDKKARTRRMLKTWGGCWLAALFFVPIPIAHFVLVPGFFFGGLVAAVYISGQKSVVLGGQGTCPSCGKPLKIVRGPDRWPLSDMCSECQAMVTIEKSPPAH